MRNTKKLLAIVLSLGMVITMLPQNAYAATASGTTADTKAQISGTVQTPEDGTLSLQKSTATLAKSIEETGNVALSLDAQKTVLSITPALSTVNGIAGEGLFYLLQNLKYTLTYSDGTSEERTIDDRATIESLKNGSFSVLDDGQGTKVTMSEGDPNKIMEGDYTLTMTCQTISTTLTAHIASPDTVATVMTDNTMNIVSKGSFYAKNYFKFTPSETGDYTVAFSNRSTWVDEYDDSSLKTEINCYDGKMLNLKAGQTVYFLVYDNNNQGAKYTVQVNKVKAPVSIRVENPLPTAVEGINDSARSVFQNLVIKAAYDNGQEKEYTVNYFEEQWNENHTAITYDCNDGIKVSIQVPNKITGTSLDAGTYSVGVSMFGASTSFDYQVKTMDDAALAYTCGTIANFDINTTNAFQKVLVVQPTKTDNYKINMKGKYRSSDVSRYCHMTILRPGNSTSMQYDSGDQVHLLAGHTYYIIVLNYTSSASVNFGLDGMTPPVAVTGVTLDKSSLELAKGSTARLQATVAPSNAENKNVTWSSSNNNVATVAVDGTITAKSNGTATITVTTADGNKTASCNVQVVSHATKVITTANASMVKGTTLNLASTMTPTDTTDQITWSSSNTKVATVSNTGKVKAVGLGSSTITATATGGKTATCKITVVKRSIAATTIKLNKSSASVNAGETVALTAKITPKKTTDTVKWSTSNKTVATVDANGIVTGIKGGTVTITAKTTGGLTATCTVTVKVPSVSVSLNKTTATVKVKKTLKLKAIMGPKGSTDTLTWTSSKKKIATVASDGTITALKKGTTTITVKTSSGKTATCTITVKK
jgi:uncharacterized protein YjdB